MTLVTHPAVRKRAVMPFDLKQTKAFLEAIEGHRLEAMFLLGILLGIRKGEVAALKWDAKDFEAKTPRVTHSLQRVAGKLLLSETKTEGSNRALPLSDFLVDKLRQHRKQQLEEKLNRGSGYEDNGFVFATKAGTPIEPRNINRAFYSVLDDAKLPRIRVHDLRHTAATTMMSQGVGMRTVMEVLGHSQISLTMNTYSHVLDEGKRAALDASEAAIPSA